MQEGYLFPQAISMLLPHHIEAHEDIQLQIDEKLRQGVGVAEIFEILQLGNHYLMAIKVAENNGHMIEAFKGVAKQITVSEKTKKKLIKLLIYPVTLMIFYCCYFCVSYIFYRTLKEWSSVVPLKQKRQVLHCPICYYMSQM